MERPDPHAQDSAAPRLEALATEPLMTREFDQRPAVVYERLRNRYGPVAPVTVHGVPMWLVLGYQEVFSVLRDDQLWRKDPANWRALREGRVPPDWPMLPGYQVSHLLLKDGEDRAAVRAALDAALRPYQDPGQPQAAELETAVARHVDELITVFADGSGSGWVDLCAQFSRPLPLLVINQMFGFPVEQGDDVFMDAWRMVDSGPDAAAAIERLLAATTQLARHKKEHPGDDLTTRLIEAAPSLPPEQIGLELYSVLVISDQINHAIANSVLEVLTANPQARASLSVGTYHELVNRVLIASPTWTNGTHRYPVTDTVLGGYRIAAGDAVLPSIAAAHADPEFRKGLGDDAVASSRGHLAWGAGAHRCPAQELAEMVTVTAISRLFDRCDLELGLPPDQIPWRSPYYVKGVKALPVRFRIRQPERPAAAAAAPAYPPPAAGAAPGAAGGAPPRAARPPRSRLWRFLAGLRGGGR